MSLLSLLKKKQITQTKKDGAQSIEECKAEQGESCPMCKVSDDIIDQLKGIDNNQEK